MRQDASKPPSLWKIPDVVGVLLLPIAVLFILIGAIASPSALDDTKTVGSRVRPSSPL